MKYPTTLEDWKKNLHPIMDEERAAARVDLPKLLERHPHLLDMDDDFFKTDTVYRLENARGGGPIMDCDYDHFLGQFFVNHLIPENNFYYTSVLFWQKASEYKPKRIRELHDNGYVYGWRSRELYDAFFNEGGEEQCARFGYHLKEYHPTDYLVLMDGQVIFKKE